jgi:hypothetical protein
MFNASVASCCEPSKKAISSLNDGGSVGLWRDVGRHEPFRLYAQRCVGAEGGLKLGFAGNWVEPKLVAEITYLTWTADNLLRHTVYVGLREDKPADQVRRE